MASSPSRPAASTSRRTVRAMLRPRARLWAARRVAATFMPAVASETNTVYTDKISWYSPIPSLPMRAATNTRNPMPSTRSTRPDTVRMAAFFR